MCEAVGADQLTHPARVTGVGFRRADLGLPLGLGEIPLAVMDDVQILRVVAVNVAGRLAFIGSDGRALEQDVVESGIGQGLVTVTDLGLNGRFIRVLQIFSRDVQVGLSGVGVADGGQATDVLHGGEAHHLGGGTVAGLPHGGRTVFLQQILRSDFAVGGAGSLIEEGLHAFERTGVGVGGCGQVLGARTPDVDGHGVADRLLHVFELRLDDVHHRNVAAVQELIFHVVGRDAEVGGVHEEGRSDDLFLGDREFGLRAVGTGMLLAVFQVGLNFETAVEGLAFLGQLPDQDMVPEIDVFGHTVEDEVIRDCLEFVEKSHALYLTDSWNVRPARLPNHLRVVCDHRRGK